MYGAQPTSGIHYSSGSPGSAAHFSVKRPSSDQAGQWGLVFGEELRGHCG